tara:strand:+ start:186 stop:638 length:453 start_codon:yes stop_codon:yes gene_type:complete
MITVKPVVVSQPSVLRGIEAPYNSLRSLIKEFSNRYGLGESSSLVGKSPFLSVYWDDGNHLNFRSESEPGFPGEPQWGGQGSVMNHKLTYFVEGKLFGEDVELCAEISKTNKVDVTKGADDFLKSSWDQEEQKTRRVDDSEYWFVVDGKR